DWVHAGLVDADLPPGAFDLVSLHYPALLKTSGQNTERVLLALVALGGTLLAVYHADMDAAHCREHGVDPDAFVWPSDVVAALDETWEVHVDERRPRQVPAGGDARHNLDFVIRARRRPDPATA
ncbi:MAG TPA: hypothetical protein VHT30_13205, partial [Acidimicrobiales bacterium]|nr:hypothetical protein [Acidimicrobiales bacterium]